MKIFILTLFLCSLLEGAPFQRNREQFFDYRKVSLENEFLSLTFAPGQLGRLAALKLKKGNIPLTGEFKLSRYTETPLFYLDSGNFQGVRELFWGRSLSGIAPMDVLSHTRSTIGFLTKSYGSSNVALIRKVSLLPQTLIVSFASVFSNTAQTDEKISVWLNLQGAPPAVPVIPVLGKGRVPLRGEMELYHRPFLFTGAGGNSNLPPAADWAAFRLPGRKVVWVMECPTIRQGGFFYSWGNQDHRAPIRTVEPVLPEQILKGGASSTLIRYRILVFPGLEHINALCGDSAVEICFSRNKIIVRLCSASASAAEEFSLTLRDTQGKTVCQYASKLKARKAGELLSLELPCTGAPVSGTLQTGALKTAVFFEKGK
jgi:hypothetical protein